MSAHCCHDDCECRLTEFWFDRTGAAAEAKERGVSAPVEFQVARRRPKRFWQFWRADDRWAESAGEAMHWSSLPLGPVNHHIITIVQADVQVFLRVLLHEIEHCIQAESFPTLKAWNRAYACDEKAWEDAANAAEEDWKSLGYLIERNRP